MKIPVRIALICFLVSIVITLGFYYGGKPIIAAELNGFWNIFLLLSAIAIGLFTVRQKEGFVENSFIDDFKISMQGGAVFVLLLALFTYLYHTRIDTEYVEGRLIERLDANIQNVPDEATYLKLQKEDPTWADKSYLDYIENQEDQATPILSAKSLAIGYLAFGLVMALFFSIFTTLIFRKVVLRG